MILTFNFIGKRILQKLKSLVPTLLLALILFTVFTVIFSLVTPLLPDNIQALINEFKSGDLEQGRDTLRAVLEQYGSNTTAIFVLIQTAQVFFSPIPGQFTGLLGGYLFGFWQGLFLTMLGLTIGSFLVMSLSRLFGNVIVSRFLPQEKASSLREMMEQGGLAKFFMIFLLPALPDDAICFVTGLTKLPIWKLTFVALLGRLPGMTVLTYIGASSGNSSILANIVIGIAILLGFVFWLFSEEIEKYFKTKVAQ